MNTNGIIIDDIFFEQSGTIVPIYKGDLKIVYY